MGVACGTQYFLTIMPIVHSGHILTNIKSKGQIGRSVWSIYINFCLFIDKTLYILKTWPVIQRYVLCLTEIQSCKSLPVFEKESRQGNTQQTNRFHYENMPIQIY